MKIIHISDLHYPKFGIEKYQAFVSEMIKNYKDSLIKPVIIVTGDVIEYRKSSKRLIAVTRLFSELKNIGFNILICPGNHDLKFWGAISRVGNKRKFFSNHLTSILPNNKLYFGSNLDSYPIIHKIQGNFFVGLDTMDEEKGFSPDGELGKKQLIILENQLEKIKKNNPDSKIIVYFHHHPFKIKWVHFYMKLKDRKKFIKIIEGVNCALFGHIHINKRFLKEEKIHKIDCIYMAGASFASKKGLNYSLIDLKTSELKTIRIK